MTDRPLLELVDLTAGYRHGRGRLGLGGAWVHAVTGVNLKVSAGRTLGIVGESGCGKSTIARTIVGLLRPTSGQALFDGEDISRVASGRLRKLRREIQMVFQDPYASLNPRMTVAKLISEGWRIHPGIVPRSEWDQEVASLLERVGLRPQDANRRPHEFSGGQRQRICIARALAVRPRLIVCDEAVSSLDVSVQAQILSLLQDLQQDTGVSYVFIAHDLGVVEHLAHEVAVMYLGTVVEYGDTREVFRTAAHPYTQALLSAVPTLDDWRPDTPQEILLSGEVPSPLRPPSGCRFRTRCHLAQDVCRQQVPTLVERGVGHPVACHLVDSGLTTSGPPQRA